MGDITIKLFELIWECIRLGLVARFVIKYGQPSKVAVGAYVGLPVLGAHNLLMVLLNVKRKYAWHGYLCGDKTYWVSPKRLHNPLWVCESTKILSSAMACFKIPCTLHAPHSLKCPITGCQKSFQSISGHTYHIHSQHAQEILESPHDQNPHLQDDSSSDSLIKLYKLFFLM